MVIESEEIKRGNDTLPVTGVYLKQRRTATIRPRLWTRATIIVNWQFDTQCYSRQTGALYFYPLTCIIDTHNIVYLLGSPANWFTVAAFIVTCLFSMYRKRCAGGRDRSSCLYKYVEVTNLWSWLTYSDPEYMKELIMRPQSGVSQIVRRKVIPRSPRRSIAVFISKQYGMQK